jgi:4-hydroxy-2-oxoheptanedioate aldolase
MFRSWQDLVGQRHGHIPRRFAIGADNLAGLIVLTAGTLTAQQAPARQASGHLNPAVAKLAAGQPMVGTSTSDLSLANAHALARSNFDYVYVDMEHGPFNFESLAWFIAGMVDKEAAVKKGSPAPNVAVFARFPPYGRENAQWIVKQALDLGLMGVIFNGIDNKEQAELMVRNMRYPQQKTSKYQQPPGLRGYAPGNAVFAWGVSGADYVRRADVWPLNPEGDLLAIPMIETAEGLKNANEIASVPGVGAIFLGAGADLSQWLGVPMNSPEVESARQTILEACKAHDVACGITETTKAGIDKRLQEGWRMIRTGAGG